ncbi:MAG: endolytic transglycosylase MltG [Bacteroidales bacterium]|nr:endolytic transglycosylase MltG [Bacteroidales bacterium]
MKRTTAIALAVIAAAVLGAGGVLCVAMQRTANSEAVRIYIPEGTTYEALCDSIDASPTFRLIAHALKLDSHVRPGSYVIDANMREVNLAHKLRNGQQDPLRLTIGKFRTPQQLNEYLDKKLMCNGFNVTIDSFYLVRPNTYEFYWTVTPEAFMERMEKEYAQFWNKAIGPGGELRADLIEHGRYDYSLENIIILASIVEEETNNAAEKPLIASVYINRLERGMPLQADPTVKYAVGDFALRRILNRHLATESPFNTYLHAGLPPAPICLPSDASVDAVLNAPKTNYLYFCASPEMDGTHRFASTLAEHQTNAAKFHRALNQRGIK